MPAGPKADEIRVTVPPLASMASIVRVAVRVLGSRAGLDDDEVQAADDAVGEAFAEVLAVGGDEDVEVLLRVSPGRLVTKLTAGAGSRSVAAPA